MDLNFSLQRARREGGARTLGACILKLGNPIKTRIPRLKLGNQTKLGNVKPSKPEEPGTRQFRRDPSLDQSPVSAVYYFQKSSFGFKTRKGLAEKTPRQFSRLHHITLSGPALSTDRRRPKCRLPRRGLKYCRPRRICGGGGGDGGIAGRNTKGSPQLPVEPLGSWGGGQHARQMTSSANLDNTNDKVWWPLVCHNLSITRSKNNQV